MDRRKEGRQGETTLHRLWSHFPEFCYFLFRIIRNLFCLLRAFALCAKFRIHTLSDNKNEGNEFMRKKSFKKSDVIRSHTKKIQNDSKYKNKGIKFYLKNDGTALIIIDRVFVWWIAVENVLKGWYIYVKNMCQICIFLLKKMHLNTAELVVILDGNWRELAFILVFGASHVRPISSERYLNFKPNE